MVRRFMLLYGSETGQAESIAQDVVSAAPGKGFEAQLHCLNDVDKSFVLEKVRCPIVIVTSTTGEGDPPDNARKFARKIKRRTLSSTYLSHISYTVLGLGDTNYENFCNCGKTLDARLTELGAKRFLTPAWADDAVGLELTVEPWLKSLWPALIAQCSDENGHVSGEEEEKEEEKEKVKEEELEELTQRFEALDAGEAVLLGDGEMAELQGKELSVPQLPAAFLVAQMLPAGAPGLDVDQLVRHNEQNFPACEGGPVAADAASCRRVTAADAVKASLLLRVRPEGAGLPYEPGDAMSVLLPNPAEEVAALLVRLGVPDAEADRPLRLRVRSDAVRGRVPAFLPPEGASLRQLLRYAFEIRAVPDKVLLRVLAESCAAAREKRRMLELCSTQGRTQHQHLLREAGLTLMDVLRAFPSCCPAVARLLERLKRLAPRPYSACCSPRAPDLPDGSVEFAASLVEVPRGEFRAARHGLTTGWMTQLADGNEVDRRVWLIHRKTNNFRLPDPPASVGEAPAVGKAPPLVLVGAGTGVAPFRGFLQHLEHSWPPGSRPDVWLFQGCRHRARDCLFAVEMEAWLQSGLLTRLSVVCSRDAADEHRYVQHRMRAEADVLATWFRRGARLYVCGAAEMAREVRQTMAELLAKDYGVTKEEADRMFAKMRVDRRYLEDAWS